MLFEEFSAQRRYIETEFGRIACVESGEGPVAVFLHGFPLNGFHWRGQLAGLGDIRRCIALDLMGLGYSEVNDDQDLSFPSQARMVLRTLDCLGIDQFDLVGNDSGGAVAQIVASMAPQRLRTLTLTNCDVHDNWPPAAFSQSVGLANAGRLGSSLVDLQDNHALAQSDFGLGVGFQDRNCLTPDAVEAYVTPYVGDSRRQSQVDEFVTSMDCNQTVSIYDALVRLRVPTCILWGDDDIFFPIHWGRWLRNTIPGVVMYREIRGGRLFLCEEMSEEINAALRDLWTVQWETSQFRNVSNLSASH